MRPDPAFERLYREEYSSVAKTVFALCRDRELARDATQEAFARALERWARLRDRDWVAGWVTTTALNVARRNLRKRSPPKPPAETDPHTAVDLWAAVRDLPRRQQEVVVLRYRFDLAAEEIAQVLNVRPTTVRTHLARATVALRESLGGHEDVGRNHRLPS